MEFIEYTGKIYVATPYTADSDGIYTAELPTRCPRPPLPGQPCDITVNHRRERKTGPCIPLFVVHCATHKISFTLYPPGHVPYGRKSITAIALDESPCINTTGKDRFGGTLFEAALDAAEGDPWAYHYQPDKTGSSFNTQTAHIQRALAMFGLDGAREPMMCESVAQVLGIPGQMLHDSGRMCNLSPLYLNRGKAIADILDIIPASHFLFERLAFSGYLAQLWPPLFFWDAQSGRYREHSFHHIGTRASPQ